MSALTLYAGGLATLAAVTRFAGYAVLAAVVVTLVSVAVLGVTGLVGRRQHRAGHPATADGKPAGGVPPVPSARCAPDDLTV